MGRISREFYQNLWRKKLQQPIRDLKVKTNKLLEAQENAGNQVASGSSFASDWLRGCFLGQSERREENPIQSLIAFDT